MLITATMTAGCWEHFKTGALLSKFNGHPLFGGDRKPRVHANGSCLASWGVPLLPWHTRERMSSHQAM